MNRTDLSQIKGVCFDIDDTFSTEGKITASAFQSLWDLRNAGFALIPVTGRPAGWCDHIARFWPVDAVVGENGAFTFFMNEHKLQHFDTQDEASVQTSKAKLQVLRQVILASFPNAHFASDQSYREFDLAIDFCEDVAPWPESEIDRLVKLCEAQGAIAKISSIHVNTWFGRYTKIEGIRAFLKHAKELKLSLPSFDELIFIGDSPNDEPMFEAFDASVGVANLKPFLPRLQHPPKYLTTGKAGEGFSELARFLQTKSS